MAPNTGPTSDNLSVGGRNNSSVDRSPEEQERRNSAIDAIVNNEKRGLSAEHMEEAPKFTSADDLPSPEEIIDRLGIPDWKQLEKKLVRRLDITLVPMLWYETASSQ